MPSAPSHRMTIGWAGEKDRYGGGENGYGRRKEEE